MRLCISPKIAIKQLDDLIREGHELINFIEGDCRLQYEELEKEKERQENELEHSIDNASEPQKTILKFKQLQENSALMFNDIPYGIIDGYKSKFFGWTDKTTRILNNINTDFAPIYSFSSAASSKKYSTDILFSHNFVEKDRLVDTLDAKIQVLVELYSDVKKLVVSPLMYLEDKCQIWFNDFVCQLKPETNESDLCRFMFQLGVGEWKDFSEIYEFIKGETFVNGLPKNCDAVVRNAYDGVNRQTHKSFGFNIFSKNKKVLCLSVPTRFLKIES